MIFSSLLSNFFYLTWSSLYQPARSSLLTLLALSDLSLSFCGLSLSLFTPSENLLARFPDQFLPWLSLHFCLSLFFPLLSLVAVVIYLLKEILITLGTRKEDVIHDVANIHKNNKNEDKKVTMNLFQLMIPACLVAFCITCQLCERIISCFLFHETNSWPSSPDGLFVQCSLQPGSSEITQRLVELTTNPLNFPLTVLTVLPVLILLARTNILFREQGAFHGRKLGWTIFLSVYSLFICDLVMFSQSTWKNSLDMRVQPLEWRNSAGSLVRTVAVVTTFELLRY